VGSLSRNGLSVLLLLVERIGERDKTSRECPIPQRSDFKSFANSFHAHGKRSRRHEYDVIAVKTQVKSAVKPCYYRY